MLLWLGKVPALKLFPSLSACEAPSLKMLQFQQPIWQVQPRHCKTLRSFLSLASPTAYTAPRLQTQKGGASRSASTTLSPEQTELQKSLAEQAPRGLKWRKVKRWVVFSDLHLSLKTIDTVLEVLQKVHDEAAQREAGVLFLGDFWHLRGSLPVEPLNAVLRAMNKWKVPVLMLVGNHDQVTAGGLSHGLTPLQAANPNIHVFDAPAFYLGALWLPYRRDPASLIEAISANPKAKAIFAHVDVIGAFMNNTFQATDGLNADLFPQNIPTFTGHYHRPHTVGDTSIRYVGSPYQVSRSEAGQNKELLVLNSNWQEQEVVPLDIGPRFFDLSQPADPVPMDNLLPSLRQGDRVRLTVQHGEAPAPCTMELLQQAGAVMELVELPADHAPRIAASEAMGPIPMFQAYAASQELSQEATAAGQKILEDLAALNASSGSRSANIVFRTLEVEGYGPFKERIDYQLDNAGIRVISGINLDDDGSLSNGAGKSALVMSALWALTGRTDPRAEGGGRVMTAADLVNDDSKMARVRVTGLINGGEFVIERATRRKKLAKLTLAIGGQDLTKADARMTQAAIEEHLAVDLLARVAFHGQNDVTALLEAGDSELKQELGRLVDIEVWEAAKAAAAEQLKAAKQASLQLEHEMAVRQSVLARLKQECKAAAERASSWTDRHASQSQVLFDQLRSAQQSLSSMQQGIISHRNRLQAWLQHHEGDEFSLNGEASTSGGPSGASAKRDANRQVHEAEMKARLASHAEASSSNEQISAANEMQPSIDWAVMQLQQTRQLQEEEQEAVSQLQQEMARLRGSSQVRQTQLREYEQLQAHSFQDDQPAVDELHCDRCLQPIDMTHYQSILAQLQTEYSADEQATLHQEALVAKQRGILLQLRDLHDEQKASLSTLQEQQFERREHAQRQQNQALQAQEAAELQQIRRQEEMQQCRKRVLQSLQETGSIVGQAERQGAAAPPGTILQSSQEALAAAEDLLHSLREIRLEETHVQRCQHTLEAHRAQQNDHQDEVQRMESMQKQESDLVAAAADAQSEAALQTAWLTELDAAFSRTGIQSFAVEGVLGELQVVTARYLEQLSTGMTLKLAATRPSAGQLSAIERISKAVLVRTAGGDVRERTLRQLSGGERRRVGLALALGFAELIAMRSHLRTNLIVLDEVLQHLDEEGNARVCSMLRGMYQDTVLIVGQADSYAAQAFDAVDNVVKQHGQSHLQLSL